MRKHVEVIALAAVGALAFGGIAKAANIGVLGTKLIVVDKGASGAKAVFVAKDPAVSKGAGTDPTTIGVTFDFTYDNGIDTTGVGQFVAAAGLPEWLVNKATVAKYVNKVAPGGPGGAKVVVIKPANLVKLVGKNLGDTPIDIFNQASAATGVAQTAFNIADSSTGFNDTFCTTFPTCAWKSIAGGTGAKLVCKGGVPDGACLASTPPPPCGPGGGTCLSFITGPAGGSCGTVRSGGALGAIRKTLTCGGLNIGGGQSTVGEGPTPAGAQTIMNISGGGPVFTVSGRTSGDTGSNNNCSATGCQFGPYLPIASAGTSTCVRNTFAAGATGTVNGTTGAFSGSFPLNSDVFLTANSASPCPKCIAGQCDPTWTQGTGNPYPDSGKACTAVNASGNTYDCAPSPATFLGPIAVGLTPITTGTASDSDPGGLFCPAQANTGAFGCAGDGSAPNGLCPGGNVAPLIDYIEEVGSPAGVLSSTPAAATLASTFCIPTVGGALGFLVNSAGNLAGPGATSLPGTLAILP
jgi:hypothetical protein